MRVSLLWLAGGATIFFAALAVWAVAPWSPVGNDIAYVSMVPLTASLIFQARERKAAEKKEERA